MMHLVKKRKGDPNETNFSNFQQKFEEVETARKEERAKRQRTLDAYRASTFLHGSNEHSLDRKTLDTAFSNRFKRKRLD